MDEIDFIDHKQIDWRSVLRTRYFCRQRFHYAYPGPIRDLKQNLVVVPAMRYGDQRLHDHQLTVTPESAATRSRVDAFGNQVLEVEVSHIDLHIAFEVQTTVERTVSARPLPRVSRARARYFLQPTRLTASDARMDAVARELAGGARGGQDLAEQISDWVSNALRYVHGVTTVDTTAVEALTLGQGICQDYAHVMIAICRSAGLPARYVSGHMLGEGGSHAWVEVVLPEENSNALRAFAFDPTNRRRPNLGYTTVAIGRDYRDVSPASGSFTAPYGGRLSFTKRAGLTLVELVDGEIIRAG
jgi:transglutaminase-like putative cysteine protease